MKVSVAALALFLISAFSSQASSAPVGLDMMTMCCSGYATRPIPRSHVKEYFYTSSMCTQSAVIFVTRKNRHICANPEDEWVRKYVNFLEIQ
ncbi:C-C motif chemokine 5-like [Alligator sinensis]|uniref:C-C motif chemokine 5 n=1 Tax=Alligator sinensis TaxID=38654 RepID=A0A1U7ST14_ALLSI|nr:C-C motif chemokine 5-like [Alligator sinensis]